MNDYRRDIEAHVAEGVPEPVAAASSLVVRGEPQRRGFLVVDVGAGTTDIGLFVITEKVRDDKARIFQVPKSISSPRMAGDTIDNILRKAILSRHSADLQSNYGQRIAADLSLRIRQFKETLFRDKALQYNLADDSAGKMVLAEFLGMEEVQRFGSQLQQRIQETFDVIDTSWLAGIFAKQDVDVVLTGGSARVEMVQQLADGITESRGMKIVRKPAQRVPDWITQDYPQFSEEYPQLAVAMGGASPNLPEVGPEIQKFIGGGEKTQYVSTVLYR